MSKTFSDPSDPATQAGDLIIRLGIFMLAIAMPCAAVVSRRTIFALTPIGVALILVGALLTPQRNGGARFLAPLLTPASLGAIFLGAWAGLSLAWTPWLPTGGERFLKTAGAVLLAGFAADLMPARTKTSNLYLIPIGLGIAAAATFALKFLAPPHLLAGGSDLDDSTLARSAVNVAMLMWPAMGALAVRDRWKSAWVTAVVAAAAILVLGSPPTIAALAVGGVVFLLAWRSAQAVAVVLAAVFGAAFCFAPFLALAAGAVAGAMHPHDPGLVQQLGALVHTEGLRLITGHGLDTATHAASAHEIPVEAPRYVIFEIWYELGVIGALASAFLCARAFLGAAKLPSPLAPFFLAGLACGLTLSVSVLPTAQIWWVILVSIVGVCFCLVKRGRYRTDRPRIALATAPQAPRPRPVL